MLKTTAQNDKLKHAIILSIVLHCILIAVLIWSAIHQLQETNTGRNSPFIEAVMVDPGAVARHYNHQQHEKQTQQRLKVQQRQHSEQQKQEERRAKKAQVQQAQNEADAVKQQAVSVARRAATSKKKKQTVVNTVQAQGKTEESGKQFREVDDLLNELANVKSMLRTGSKLVSVGNSKQSNAISAEIDAYKVMVSNAIKNKFYNYTSYVGKTCDLRIKLGPSGMLISVSSTDGDPALCQAAISAAKAANIPRPPNSQLYEIFKSSTLKFAPQ